MTKMKRVTHNNLIFNVYIADNFKKRLFGYMFRKEPHYEAILFVGCNSIHTYFMRFSIDVLFINQSNMIIKKIENLEKGHVIMPIEDVYYVLEGRSGMFKDVLEGEIISFKN